MNTMTRRGPDSAGLETWPGVVLGHRRLAILDLSAAGNQPMLSDDGRIGLVFNGCIYNFMELRASLEQCGHRFRSHCDTEVLLRGYQEWGIDVLASRLRGMYAFAFWDDPRRRLTLVRDRLGVKPLIYSLADGEIAFASTVSALRAGGFGGGITPEAVLDFLEFGWVQDRRSIFEGISKLPPATILEWQDGTVTRRQYWSLPEPGDSPRVSFQEAVEETERLLVESVKLRLISDVPVGALLSGGIDSTLVCWAMRQLNANITAFTVRAPGDPSDESQSAAETAKLLDIPHQIVDMPNGDFQLEELIDAYGEPFACQSAQAMLWVSRAVRPHATVLLTGDGGDEIFLGYGFLRDAWRAQRLARRTPPAAAAAWRAASPLVPQRGLLRRARNFLGYATGGIAEIARAHDGLPYYEQRSMLGEKLFGREIPERRLEPSLEGGRRLLADLLEYHRRMHFSSEFMPKVDGGTMYYSIEARAPLLDQRLWEFAAALTPEVRFHGGQLKAVLREIVRRRAGPEIASRRKQGFTVPVEEWLAGRWSGMLERLRGDTILERQGWIAAGSLRAPLDGALRDRRVPLQLWRLLVLDHWLENNPVAAPAGRTCRIRAS